MKYLQILIILLLFTCIFSWCESEDDPGSSLEECAARELTDDEKEKAAGCCFMESTTKDKKTMFFSN